MENLNAHVEPNKITGTEGHNPNIEKESPRDENLLKAQVSVVGMFNEARETGIKITSVKNPSERV
jgi:hypothetical protein